MPAHVHDKRFKCYYKCARNIKGTLYGNIMIFNLQHVSEFGSIGQPCLEWNCDDKTTKNQGAKKPPLRPAPSEQTWYMYVSYAGNIETMDDQISAKQKFHKLSWGYF